MERGDRVGVIGHNGAGKSTLLKLLAGVYRPTHGTMVVEGKISSLFDLTLGFEPDATGWENIAYRSYLQGETPRTVKDKRDAIAEFSELGDFLNTPVRYYSAGMLVRLAFSIATAIDPRDAAGGRGAERRRSGVSGKGAAADAQHGEPGASDGDGEPRPRWRCRKSATARSGWTTAG